MDPDRSPEAHATAQALRLECVVRARGQLVPRSDATRNDQLPTGAVELAVESLELLSSSEVLPFQMDDENVDEGLRIKHRYLDLRRPRMQELQGIRTRAVRSIRRFLDERGFLDLETPTMTRATPEGARDFVIPFRLEPGAFYALPQSPQLYKQLLMCGGFDRYYQIARCWRDEAQRADRALEFTQLDLEMSFVEREDILTLTEQLMAEVWRDAGHEVELPFPRMPYDEALARYGSDKPDLRYDLEIGDVSEAVAGSEFGVFSRAVAAGGAVRCLSVPGAAEALSRKDYDELAEFAKEWGGKGLAYLIFEADGSLRSPIAKFLSEAEIAAIREASGAEPGSVVFVAADSQAVVERVLGALRPHMARRFELIPEGALALPLRGRLPALQAGRRRRLDGRAPSLHGAQARARGAARERPGRGLFGGLRPGAERPRDGLGLDPHQSRRAADPRARRDRHRPCRGRGALRLPAARAALRRTAARRHRARHRPHRDAAGRHRQPARGRGVPEARRRRRPAHGRTGAAPARDPGRARPPVVPRPARRRSPSPGASTLPACASTPITRRPRPSRLPPGRRCSRICASTSATPRSRTGPAARRGAVSTPRARPRPARSASATSSSPAAPRRPTTSRSSGRAVRGPGRIVTTPLEHPAVSGATDALARAGCEVVLLPVDADGRVPVAALDEAVRPG